MHALRQTPHRRWLLSLAAWLLMLTQGLGLVHRVQHGRGITPVAAAPSAATDADGYGHAAGSVECRLLDQLSQLDGATCPVVVTVALADDPLAAPAAVRAALAARLWRAPARGPPAFA